MGAQKTHKKINKIQKHIINWSDDHKVWLLDRETKKKITIIMCTVNRTIELERAILSVLHQANKDWELLIIGDECTKETAAVANMYQQEYDDIMFFHLKKDFPKARFGSEQRNFTCEYLAQTPYVAYLDDDNHWRPNHLCVLLDLILEEDYDFVYGGIEDRNTYAPHTIAKLRNDEEYSWNKRRTDTSCLMHKTELIPDKGQWRTRMYVGLDIALVEDFIRRGATHKGSKKITMVYYNSPKVQSRKNYTEKDYLEFVINQVKQQKQGVPL